MRRCIVVLMLMAASPAIADTLPKGAAPLSAADVTKIYSGRTQIANMSDIYFSPDGTTKGVFGKPQVKFVFSGTWRVTDNEMCMDNKGTSADKPATDCNKFWRKGKTVYGLWTVHFDGSKPDLVNDYSPEATKKFKAGDLVSKRYEAAASGG